MGEGHDEYPDDPESINFIAYDCTRLFVEGTDNPFFADRIFANRLLNMIDGFRGGTQQNKIYLFDGPPGCGKSIFLNNLLQKFEEYANSPDGRAATRWSGTWTATCWARRPRRAAPSSTSWPACSATGTPPRS